MNAQTDIAARTSARNYVARYGDYTGKIRRPVLTMHTLYDVQTPVATEGAYRNTVSAAGNESLLRQVYTTGVGHCAFTPEQLLAAVQAMESWLETGVAPGDGFFPAALGFDNDFEPPPWP